MKPVEAKEAASLHQGLLQIAQPALQSGGGVVGGPGGSTTTSSSGPTAILSTAAFSIPGIPTPSLSGVLTGIKSAPLFSLPGKRLESATVSSTVSAKESSSTEKTVPYVLGMPGPYSQSSALKQAAVMTATAASTTMTTTVKTTAGSSTIPTITVSPASTTGEIKVEVESSRDDPNEDSKFLRPSSLSLAPGSSRQKRHVMLASSLGGATLVSPETPRPRKSYALTYQNGTAYTYLGLKCSTRVYYCTVFHQQPMYVPHKPRLSMYSNWKVVTKNPHPSGLKPKESLVHYDSSRHDASHGIFVAAGRGKKEVMIVAHSSQWKESERRRKRKAEEEEKKRKEKAEGEGKEKMNVDEKREAADGANGEIQKASEMTESDVSSARKKVSGGFVSTGTYLPTVTIRSLSRCCS